MPRNTELETAKGFRLDEQGGIPVGTLAKRLYENTRHVRASVFYIADRGTSFLFCPKRLANASAAKIDGTHTAVACCVATADSRREHRASVFSG